MEKIVVIGGSVAGGFSALNLAKDFDVEIIEEHNHFKKTCSGILTDPINDIIKVRKPIIENKISQFRIYAPNKDFVELNFQKPDIVFNRERLNEFIVDKAVKAGAKLSTNTRFVKTKNSYVIVRKQDSTKRNIKTQHLIGADGALSSVAKSVNMFHDRKFFLAGKALVKMKNDNAVEVYPYCGCFSWVVPRTEYEVEVGTMSHYSDPRAFMNFLQRFDKKIISKEASIIPIYNPRIPTFKKFNNINTYLVGDSATMAKATTGGSIMQSLIAARILSDSIKRNTNYERNWKKTIGRQLFLHLKMRNVMDKFSLEDWNELVRKMKDETLKNILEGNSRDNPDFIFRMILSNPSLLKFTRVLLRC